MSNLVDDAATIRRLQATIERLQDELLEAGIVRRRWKKLRDEGKEEILSLKRKNVNLEDELRDFRMVLEQVNGMNRDFETEIDSLKVERESLLVQRSQLILERDTALKERDEAYPLVLRQKIGRLETRVQRAAEAYDELADSWVAAINKKEDTHRDLRTVESQVTALAEARERAENAERNATLYRNRRNALIVERDQALFERDVAVRKQASTNDEYHGATNAAAHFLSQRDECRESLRLANAQLARAQTDAQALARRRDELNQQLNRALNERNTFVKNASRGRTRIKELDERAKELHENITKKSQHIAAQAGRIRCLQREVVQHEDCMGELHSELNDVRETLTQESTDKLVADVSRLERDLKMTQGRLRGCGRDVMRISQQRNDLQAAALDNPSEDLNKQVFANLATAQAKVRSLELMLEREAYDADKVAELTDELKSEHDQRLWLETSRDSDASIIEVLRERLSDAERVDARRCSDLMLTRELGGQAATELAQAQHKVKALQHRLGRIASGETLAALGISNLEHKEQITRLEEHEHALESRILDLEGKLTNITRIRDNEHHRVDELRKKLREARDMAVTIRTAFNALLMECKAMVEHPHLRRGYASIRNIGALPWTCIHCGAQFSLRSAADDREKHDPSCAWVELEGVMSWTERDVLETRSTP